MNSRSLAGASALLMLVVGFPSPAESRCAAPLPVVMCSSAGMSVIGTTTRSHFVDATRGIGGSFWMAGFGDPAPGSGIDAGDLARPVVHPAFGPGGWLTDYVIGDGSSGERCFIWDWSSGPIDGCPPTAGPEDVPGGGHRGRRCRVAAVLGLHHR